MKPKPVDGSNVLIEAARGEIIRVFCFLFDRDNNLP
jgi:hypothetical protein